MKKNILLLLSLLPLAVAAMDAPPMPPATPPEPVGTVKPAKVVPAAPKECNAVPPMLIYLPPELEKDLMGCKNLLYKPTEQAAAQALEKLYKQKVSVKEVAIEPKFKELYRISVNVAGSNKTLYCNGDVDSCLELQPANSTPAKKAKGKR